MTIDVVEFFQSLRNGFFDFFFNMISFLGEEYVYILIISIVYFAYNKKLGEYLAFMLMFTGLFNNVLKGLFDRPRPFDAFENRVENLRPDTSTGMSFPSGHTQNFSAFWFAFAFKFKKNWLFITAAVLSILMAISRMYLGVHFLEDVIASIILGIVTAYGTYKLFQKYGDNDVVLHRLYIGILVVFLPFLFILNGEDYFKGYGLFLGFALGMIYEKKYVHFSLDVAITKKVIRVAVGLVFMVIIKFGGSMIFEVFADEGTTLMNILDAFRYFLIAFIGLGIYPLLFKKLSF